MLGVLTLASSAFAQSIPEGDFESPGDLTGWTEFGETNRITEEPSTIIGGRVMLIDRRMMPAMACSSSFVVTRTTVTALMYAYKRNSVTAFRVREPGGAILVEDDKTPDDDDYLPEQLDVSGICGQTVEVCVEPDRDDGVAYDQFVLEGPPCGDYVDNDGDGACVFGRDLNADGGCADAGEFDDPAFDCDDADPTRSSLVTEVCNGLDDDCDLVTDDGFDVDADGVTTCAGDCDDGNEDVSPLQLEVCNGLDDDCNDGIDEDFDLDHDGRTTCDGDCDDENANIHPDATEQCNGADDDCDGVDDEDIATVPWWPDDDRDGHGDATAKPVEDCVAPDGWVGVGDDCDDGNENVYPGAEDEAVDGVDDDCDGRDGPPEPTGTTDPGPGDSGGGGTGPDDPPTTDPTEPPDPGPGPEGGIDDPPPAVAVQIDGCGCRTGPVVPWWAALAAVAAARARRSRRR